MTAQAAAETMIDVTVTVSNRTDNGTVETHVTYPMTAAQWDLLVEKHTATGNVAYVSETVLVIAAEYHTVTMRRD
jgi:hypothetical protein